MTCDVIEAAHVTGDHASTAQRITRRHLTRNNGDRMPDRDNAALVDRYIASWNETDAERRRALIADTFTPDVRYVDPMMRGDGHSGIDALVDGVHAKFPGFRFALSRAVESVDDHVRFSWQLGPAEAPGLIEGTDVARVADGRFAAIHGFLDRVPEGAA